MHALSIYTDGACSGNGTAHSRGGWAAIVSLDGNEHSKELSGGEKPTTNQRMEIRAVIEGLKSVRRPCTIAVYSDSAYVITCMTKRWYDKWRTNGWINSKKEPVANRELWEQLLDVVENRGHTISFVKVKGHADLLGRASTPQERFNQRCDELAVAACPA